MAALFGRWRQVRQFAVAAVRNHTRPLKVIHDFVCLHAYSWIRAHPFNLLSKGGKPIEMRRFIHEVNRHNVRLIIARTRESSKRNASEQVVTISCFHLVYQHDQPPNEVRNTSVNIPTDSASRGEGGVWLGAPEPWKSHTAPP